MDPGALASRACPQRPAMEFDVVAIAVRASFGHRLLRCTTSSFADRMAPRSDKPDLLRRCRFFRTNRENMLHRCRAKISKNPGKYFPLGSGQPVARFNPRLRADRRARRSYRQACDTCWLVIGFPNPLRNRHVAAHRTAEPAVRQFHVSGSRNLCSARFVLHPIKAKSPELPNTLPESSLPAAGKCRVEINEFQGRMVRRFPFFALCIPGFRRGFRRNRRPRLASHRRGHGLPRPFRTFLCEVRFTRPSCFEKRYLDAGSSS